MNPYYEQQILNSDPVTLIRLVYQRAITSVEVAREHLRRKRIVERSVAITRAYSALAHLLCALSPEAAPDLCGRLSALYLFMQRRLLDANLEQADRPLEEVLGLLRTLKEAWSGVENQLAEQELADASDYAMSLSQA
jgi:flagellar protein FliS